MSVLPIVTNDDELDALHGQPATCLAAIRAVARREDLPTQHAEFFRDGSAIVGSAGDTVIKMFAPHDRAHMETEARVLAHLHDRLSCPTPELVGRGELEGWPYVLMTRLEGQMLSSAWESLPSDAKLLLPVAIGRVAAELHRLPTQDVGDIAPTWSDFIADQRVGCVARQRGYELDESWLEQIEPFLDSVKFTEQRSVLLHTELMREHFLVSRVSGTWELSGLFDFEPSMIGHPEYDFASVGLFVTKGDPASMGCFHAGYGVSHDEELPRRAMAYALLHRYSCLPWYLRELPHEGARTFDDLAQMWWGA